MVIAHNEHALLNTSTPPLLPNYVTFKVHPDCAAFCKENNIALPELLPLLPSPDLINLRAACTRVAHMSGVAEQIRHIYLFIGGDVSVTLTKIVLFNIYLTHFKFYCSSNYFAIM